MPSYIDIAGWVDSTSEATSASLALGCKRTRPLAEMDANATPKRPRSSKPAAPASVTGVDNENAGFDDIDGTPRAPKLSSALPLLSNAYVLDRPPSTSSSKRSYSGDEESSSRRSESGSSKWSKRSGSPQKQSSDRQYGLYPVVYAAGDMNDPSKLPKAVDELVKPLKRIARDIAVLHVSFDTPAVREAVGGADVEESVFRDHAGKHKLPALEDVKELVEKTAACNVKSDGAFESAWNCEVHYPLLEMARKSSRHKPTLRWHNITNASISPRFLVPDLREKEKIQSRKVDFSLSIQLPYSARRHLAQQNLQLNQTDYGPVKYNPLAISIETKLSGEGGLEAQAQVSTWAEAQVRQLRVLLQQAGHPQSQSIFNALFMFLSATEICVHFGAHLSR